MTRTLYGRGHQFAGRGGLLLQGLIGAVCLLLVLAPSKSLAACSNEGLRSGPSNDLPDCRAYELVTPADSGGRNFFTIESELPFNMFRTPLVTASGDSALFMTNGRPLHEPAGATGIEDIYQSVRKSTGWEVVRRLTPSGDQATYPNPGGVSADHRYTFIAPTPAQEGESSGTLAEEGTATYIGGPDGSFELAGAGSLATERPVIGRYISPSGAHIIFTTTEGFFCSINCALQQLEPNAPPTGTEAIYDRSAGGPLRVISLLPGNIPPGAGEDASYQGTSADGAVVAFKVQGVLYARINDVETKEVTAEEAVFAGLSEDGSHLFYVNNGEVFVFDTGSGTTQKIVSTGDAELVNISADGSHVYFISRTVVPGAGGGEAGQPNLYAYGRATDTTNFIGTVAQADLEGEPALNRWTSDAVTPAIGSGKGPGGDSSRSTPDGNVLVFESRAKLTNYENQGYVEIYRYDVSSNRISCASCNPDGEPATADARLEALRAFNTEFGGESMVINNVSSDGSRIFFETTESLAGPDTDGVNDIYEWRQGAPPALISSGNSVFHTSPVPLVFPEPNVIFGITPSGNDLIFRTGDRLLPQAGGGGAEALYDARVGGGFPEAMHQCQAEACNELVGHPPDLASPVSNIFAGKGNVKRHHRCHKARHHSKGKHGQRCHPSNRKGAAK